jgi:hypothetical protein
MVVELRRRQGTAPVVAKTSLKFPRDCPS